LVWFFVFLFFIFFGSVVSGGRSVFNVEVPVVVVVPNQFGLTRFLPLLVFFGSF
jgi:hypothetical protein